MHVTARCVSCCCVPAGAMVCRLERRIFELTAQLKPCAPLPYPQVLWALAGMSKSSIPERKQAAVEIIEK